MKNQSVKNPREYTALRTVNALRVREAFLSAVWVEVETAAKAIGFDSFESDDIAKAIEDHYNSSEYDILPEANT